MAAIAGDEPSPTPKRAEACFDALRALHASASQPFKLVLQVLHRELHAAVYDVTRGANVTNFDEALRLRALVAQRDAQLAYVRAALERVMLENRLLSVELGEADVPKYDDTLSAALPAKARGDGGWLVKMATEASGRNVFDRVENAAAHLKRNAQNAASRRVDRLLSASGVGGAPAPDAPAAGGAPSVADIRVGDFGDGAPASSDSAEVRQLRQAVQSSVPRAHYDAVCAQLKEAQSRLMEALTIRGGASPTQLSPPPPAAEGAAAPSSAKDDADATSVGGASTPRPDWGAVAELAAVSAEMHTGRHAAQLAGVRVGQSSTANAAALVKALSGAWRQIAVLRERVPNQRAFHSAVPPPDDLLIGPTSPPLSCLDLASAPMLNVPFSLGEMRRWVRLLVRQWPAAYGGSGVDGALGGGEGGGAAAASPKGPLPRASGGAASPESPPSFGLGGGSRRARRESDARRNRRHSMQLQQRHQEGLARLGTSGGEADVPVAVAFETAGGAIDGSGTGPALDDHVAAFAAARYGKRSTDAVSWCHHLVDGCARYAPTDAQVRLFGAVLRREVHSDAYADIHARLVRAHEAVHTNQPPGAIDGACSAADIMRAVEGACPSLTEATRRRLAASLQGYPLYLYGGLLRGMKRGGAVGDAEAASEILAAANMSHDDPSHAEATALGAAAADAAADAEDGEGVIHAAADDPDQEDEWRRSGAPLPAAFTAALRDALSSEPFDFARVLDGMLRATPEGSGDNGTQPIATVATCRAALTALDPHRPASGLSALLAFAFADGAEMQAENGASDAQKAWRAKAAERLDDESVTRSVELVSRRVLYQAPRWHAPPPEDPLSSLLPPWQEAHGGLRPAGARSRASVLSEEDLTPQEDAQRSGGADAANARGGAGRRMTRHNSRQSLSLHRPAAA